MDEYINKQDKLFLRKLYILFGNGVPYFRSTLRRLEIKNEFSDEFDRDSLYLHNNRKYLRVTHGDDKTYCMTENIIIFTDEGIKWLMQD